jgi:serine/threonine-protein kinase
MLQGDRENTRAFSSSWGADALEASHWQELQQLFHLAELAPPGERTRILTEACSNSLLVDCVLALLAQTDRSFGELSAPLGVLAAGTRVGPYSLLRHLGTGGVGTVYLVERIFGGAVQRCALKVMDLHTYRPEFRSRFLQEQQVLANLEHPNITRLLDAGFSETAQPYLVMEFVDGSHLLQHCDQGKLSVAQRISIFLGICDAVAYAHRNLTVHLDLKPSNVMVSTDGAVKLLDFGTARLLGGGDDGTPTLLLATPAYASPEQLRGEPVTTACDLYSLGAMLFELLSGKRPFPDGSPPLAAERALREQEPERLTAALTETAAELRGVSKPRLHHLLAGDLSTIVARCLRSRPQDRYASVDALGDDLRRYCEGLPVLARKQTLSYRAAKFVRRHPFGVPATALGLLLCIGAGAFAYVRQQQALREGRRAEQMQDFLSQLFKLANQNYTGKGTVTIPEFLELGVKVLPSMIQDPAERRVIQLRLGESMIDTQDYSGALATLQPLGAEAGRAGDFGTAAEADAFAGWAAHMLGRTTLADALTGKAFSLAHAKGVSAGSRVWATGWYGVSRAVRGFDLGKNVGVMRAAAEEAQRAHLPKQQQIWALSSAALYEPLIGDLDGASAHAQSALELANTLPYPSCQRALVLMTLSNIRAAQHDAPASVDLDRRAYADSVACSGPDSEATLIVQVFMARQMLLTGKPRQVIALLEPTLPAWARRAGGTQDMSVPFTVLGRAYVMVGDYAKAEGAARACMAAQEGRIQAESARVAVCYVVLAQALQGEKRDAEALSTAERALAIYSRLRPLTPSVQSFADQAQAVVDGINRHSRPATATP